MNSLSFLEELTEQQESTIQGGRTRLFLGGNGIALTGNPKASPLGAYVSLPLAAIFPKGIPFGIRGFGISFEVSQMSDVPTNNFLSGPFGNNPNGLAGRLGLPTGPFSLV